MAIRGDLVRDVVARSLGLDALTRKQVSLFSALQDIHDEWDCDVRYGVEMIRYLRSITLRLWRGI